MNKRDFLSHLRKGLSGLPQKDREERLTFYCEMIDDRMEEGLSEEDAVGEVGAVEAVIAEIVAETPLYKIVKEKVSPKRHLKAWEILLLSLGSPIWLSLLVSAVAVVFSLYVSLWAVIVSLWAVFASLVGCEIGFVIEGVVLAAQQNLPSGVAVLGAGVFAAGLTILFFFACRAATLGTLYFTKELALLAKKRIMGGKKAK